jgi:D-sedoheptulose 7-phosphate isomerase
MINTIRSSLEEARSALEDLLANEETLDRIAAAAVQLGETLENGGRIFACGNGGSMCDATHFAEELTGRYRKNRRGLAAMAINDPSHITCVGNDFGFDEVFSRYIEAHGRMGDVLVALSTSGRSPNVIKAVAAAETLGMFTIALTGRDESPLAKQADIAICTPAGQFADRVQELHIKVLHILIELVERSLCPENL